MTFNRLVTKYFCLVFFLIFSTVYGADTTKDFKEKLSLAKSGNSASQLAIGMMYHTANNYPEAIKWYKKATEQGVAIAQHNLGVLYFDGKGVPVNYPEAFKWYKKAAEQGVVFAQYNLGNMYYYGKGIPVNYPEAFEWYKKAAEHGYAHAQYNLSLMYKNGQGVARNPVQAAVWYRKSAEQGDRKSKL